MKITRPIKVFIVDDNQVVLDGLNTLLKDQSEIELVGTALNGKDLLNQLEKFKEKGLKSKYVDVILMDLNMPIMDGFKATEQVKSIYPRIKVLILTMSDTEQIFQKIMEKGADGFISKSQDKRHIIDGIRKVFKNEFVKYSDTEEMRQFSSKKENDTSKKKIRLSSREKQIICLSVQGYDLSKIVQILNMSKLTITTYLKIIFSKLEVSNIKEMIEEALDQNLCED